MARSRRRRPATATAIVAPALAGKRSRLQQLLEQDERFQVASFDGLHWLDPFSGEAISAPFDWQQSAMDHLLSKEDIDSEHALCLQELHQRRWLLHLKERIRDDKRFQLFDTSGRWLNPVSNQFSEQVYKHGSKIDTACLAGMASELSADPSTTPDSLASLQELQQQLPDQTGSSRHKETKVKTSSHRIGSMRIGQETRPQSTQGETERFLRKAGDKAEPDNQDLVKARAVQQRLLGEMPTIPGYELAVVYEPYDMIGGDFYETILLPDGRYLLAMGDVSGHGVQAALIVVTAIKTLRFLSSQPTMGELPHLVQAFNRSIKEDLVPGQFLTAFFAILSPDDGNLELLCCGHHPALVGHSEGDIILRRLGSSGPAIGLLADGSFASSLQTSSYQLQAGDTLFQYTDGVSEASNAAGAQLGDQNVIGAFTCNLGFSCERILRKITTQVLTFTAGKRDDDFTMWAIRRTC